MLNSLLENLFRKLYPKNSSTFPEQVDKRGGGEQIEIADQGRSVTLPTGTIKRMIRGIAGDVVFTLEGETYATKLAETFILFLTEGVAIQLLLQQGSVVTKKHILDYLYKYDGLKDSGLDKLGLDKSKLSRRKSQRKKSCSKRLKSPCRKK